MRNDRRCSQAREKAVETGLNGLPEDLRRHVDSCPPCRVYIRSAEALKRSLSEGPLYTTSLRRKTLRAVDIRVSVPASPRWPFLLVPAGLILNLFLSVVLPAGIFHQVLPAALGRTLLGTALSVLAAAGIGTATALVCFISMKANALKEVYHA